MKKKTIALMLAAAMFVGLLAGCGSNGTPTGSSAPGVQNTGSVEPGTSDNPGDSAAANDGPVYGGNVTMYFNNLQLNYDQAAVDFENYMFWYERLWAIDWTQTSNNFYVVNSGCLTGQIADTWEWDGSARTLTVNIRDDIYFQTLDAQYDYYGGRNLVADDVKWSYERVMGIGQFSEPAPSMMNWPGTLSMVESIETVGDYTVVFHFNTDSEVAVNSFMEASVCIAGHEWGELTEEQRGDWHYACGTGPFIISDYDEATTMTLVRNENYYDYDERYPENKLPYLDSVTLVKIEDTATLMSEFIAGQVDFVGNNWSVFSSSEAQQIANSMDASAFDTYDLDITGRGITLKQTNEVLRDPKVREALQYAINIEEVATRYFDLEDWTFPSLFSASTQYCTKDEWDSGLMASYTTYDPELAKQMLAEAGYPDGLTLACTYVDSGDATDLYLLIQQYLSAVGVTLELKPASNHADFISTVTSMTDTVCGVTEMGVGSTMALTMNWHTGAPEYGLGGSDELDAMIDAIGAATTVAEQTAAVRAIDRYFMENHYVLLVGPCEKITYFANSKLGGYNGEDLFVNWNAPSILTRVWSKTGA